MADPDRQLSELPLLTEPERQQLLVELERHGGRVSPRPLRAGVVRGPGRANPRRGGRESLRISSCPTAN